MTIDEQEKLRRELAALSESDRTRVVTTSQGLYVYAAGKWVPLKPEY